MSEQKQNAQVAIVGGGPAGLSVARALKSLDINFTLFEKHDKLGGLWDAENEGSPLYESAHFISSKTTSGNIGFPMPDDFPDYPSNQQILKYIRSYADFLDFSESVELNTSVINTEKTEPGWSVSTKSKDQIKTRNFDFLVCANGTNWNPNRPELKGEKDFNGEIIHAVDYANSDQLRGKRVVIVGAGNSAVDIACDAAFSAKQAYTSMRRGYHFLPKHLFGKPIDVFSQGSQWMPIKLQQLIFGMILRLLNGDLSRLGLQKPDHKILESHPILNNQILHYLQHGDLIAKPDIDYLSGDEVVFKDGSKVKADKIILATGYNWQIPYIDKRYFDWKNSRPKAFLKMFNTKEPTLFLNGFIEINSSAYKLFDEMGLLIARGIDAQIKRGQPRAQFLNYINGQEPNLGGPVNYVKSDRHTNYVNKDAIKAAFKDMQKSLAWANAETTYLKN